ncbi:MAG: hypothetical protein CL930_01405 [Deltaproteobacteria bacterium]|nr:hypothetical protein [Deltaproteobacteria bacterium]|tara:strand:+ start:769 stop:1557 length:789 start_codon:yes stop_codon:yes gene_type:complete
MPLTVSDRTKIVGVTSLGALGLLTMGMIGCDAVKNVVGEILPPDAEFSRVDLKDKPTARELARYACHQAGGNSTICGNNISKDKLLFSFDIVFDLANNNEKVPIPLVEILLGVSVYDDENLGAVCISFCDPEDPECASESNAEGACDAENAEEVTTAADIVPTVDELTNIAESVADGDFGNHEFRTIPAQEEIEAHIQFDFNIDTMLDLSVHILTDLGEDLLAGRDLRANIPYVMDGSLFFDIPEMGRHAIGFGPIEDRWTI